MDWNKMRHLESLFEKYSIKPVIGVIPNNKDDFFFNHPRNENFWEQIRKEINTKIPWSPPTCGTREHGVFRAGFVR